MEPVRVHESGDLSTIYAEIGLNQKLHLSGRPIRRLRSLTTSRIFRVSGETVVFLPSFLDPQKFYLTLDYHFLVAQIRSELAYIHSHWHDAQVDRRSRYCSPMSCLSWAINPSTSHRCWQLIQELKDGQLWRGAGFAGAAVPAHAHGRHRTHR
jgi:hypothetical protein